MKSELSIRQLPVGTLTFLFTDIEGSTELLRRLRDQYAALLAEQRRILRAAFEQWNGHEVDTQGDAFFVAFPRATDALAAALEVQTAVARHAWPGDEELRIRIGLHTGEPQIGATGYVGIDVHRAARICSIGYGGQVLVSQTTALLVRDELPDEVGLRDLGDHRLKDLRHAERIYQLVVPDLPEHFPPLKSLDLYPHNLPVQPTPLLGREEDLMRGQDLLSRPEVRLLTMTGPGGTGKTRLALQLAAEVSGRFPDGVFFVPLAPITEAGLVFSAIAQVLGIREIATRPLQETLTDDLSSKNMLLVLDNFEHLISGSSLVAELMAACPQIRLIVTSREALRLRGEHEFAVMPLALPEVAHLPSVDILMRNPSVALFAQRAQAAQGDFSMSEKDASAVAEICMRLDGLPLAIELAAARIKLLPPPAMLVRLTPTDDRTSMDLLAGGPRDAPDRHQTLHSTIEWSHDLLNANEQALFRQLSVFMGGFSLPAAEEVRSPSGGAAESVDHATDPNTIDGISSLLDKSLVRRMDDREDSPRFAMLEMIREYAWERLRDSGEFEAIRSRHAKYFLNYALQAEPYLESRDQADWLDRLEVESANLRSALGWSLEGGAVDVGLELGSALCLFWLMRGYLSEGSDWLQKLLSMPGAEEDASLYARALDRYGLLARYQGNYSVAAEVAGKSLSIRRDLGDQQGIADSLANLGFVVLQGGDYRKARELYQESLSINRASENLQGIADSLSHLALLSFYQGDYVTARAMDEESLAIWRELGDHQGIAWAEHRLGNVVFQEGEYSRARELFKECLKLSQDIGYLYGIAFALEGLASCAAIDGQPELALIMAGSAEGLRGSIGMPLSEAAAKILENTLESAYVSVTEAEIGAARDRSSEMSLDEVVSMALEKA